MSLEVKASERSMRSRRFRFRNRPAPAPRELYERAISRVVERLRSVEGLLAVYQIGHVSAPGISDIDLLAVFEDEVTCDADPLTGLPSPERKLFTHSVFGLGSGCVEDARRYTLYHNYRLLWGRSVGVEYNEGAANDDLKKQIALEFLVANYISRAIEYEGGVVGIRNVLLSTNAIRYDLDFLGIENGELHGLVHELIEWRSSWFVQGVRDAELSEWYSAFQGALYRTLVLVLEQQRLRLPPWAGEAYSRNVRLLRAPTLAYRRVGVMMPPALAVLSKRAARLSNRLSRFEFGVPTTWTEAGDLLDRRALALGRMNDHNRKHLRSFAPLGGGLSRLFLPGPPRAFEPQRTDPGEAVVQGNSISGAALAGTEGER